MVEVSFRDYESGDFGEFEAMALGLYSEDTEGQPMSSAKIRSTVRELTARPEKGKIVIFENAEGIVGYAILIFFWSNEYGGDIIHVDELYVKPQWRSRGIASRFFDYLADYREERTVALMLEVHSLNRRALDLYLRRGFAQDASTHLFKRLR
ncbi:MAG: GNAT family N-acetyltransferase [Chloroflexi bacterium]|nr:GNAT family N-acetyltransferase [Chloroflexota bacterium]